MNNIDGVFMLLDAGTRKHSYSCYDRAIRYSATHEDETLLDVLPMAALYHDIGKIDYLELVTKPAKLTDDERALINYHPINSYLICKEYGLTDEICKAILLHHDPSCLSIKRLIDTHPHINSSILDGITERDMYLAKYLSMIDITDALLEDRPYKKPMSKSDALIAFTSAFPHESQQFYAIA